MTLKRSKRHLRYIKLARLLWYICYWYTWTHRHERIVKDWTLSENWKTRTENDAPRTIILRKMEKYIKVEARIAERLLEQVQKTRLSDAKKELPGLTVKLRMARDTIDHMQHAIIILHRRYAELRNWKNMLHEGPLCVPLQRDLDVERAKRRLVAYFDCMPDYGEDQDYEVILPCKCIFCDGTVVFGRSR